MAEIGKQVRELLGQLVKQAALLGDAAPLVRERAGEIERVIGRAELILALVGDCVARTELVNRVIGQELLEGQRREPPTLVTAFRRGAVVDYKARLSTGASERFVRVDPDESAELAARLEEVVRKLRAASESGAAEAGDRKVERAQTQAAVVSLRSQAAAAFAALPAVYRRRPPWWAVWLWIARLALWPFSRRERAAYARAMAQLGAGAAELAAIADDGAPQEVTPESSQAVVSLQAKRDRLTGELREQRAARAERFISAVRALTDEGGRGHGVVKLTVDVPGEALPAGLVVLDVPGGCSIDEADGWIAAGTVSAEQSQALATRRIASVPADLALGAVVARLRSERERRIAVRAGEAVSAALAALKAREQTAAQSWRERLAAAMALRVADPAGMAAQQLQRCTGKITERAHLAIEHATRQLAESLAHVEQDWHAVLGGAGTVEALRAAAAKIDAETARRLAEVREQTELALRMVVRGAARDLAPEALAGLESRWKALGGEGELAAEDGGEHSALTAAPSLTKAGAGPLLDAGWLKTLFTSFDQLRQKAVGRLDERMAKLRAAATAELLDAEPPVTAALRKAAERVCVGVAARLAALADQRVAAEQAAIEKEKAELAPVLALKAQLDAEVARIKGLAAS